MAIQTRVGNLRLDLALEGTSRPLALIGPNGAGKTTLLKIMGGLIRPQRGYIELAGTRVFCTKDRIERVVRGPQVGYVPQGYALFPHLSAIENVCFGLRLQRPPLSCEQLHKSALSTLDQLGVADLAGARVTELSGGQQQRIALARALVSKPALLLLDEPMSALDVQSRKEVRRWLGKTLRAWKVPAIVVSHSRADLTSLDSDIAVLERGMVVQRGSLLELGANPQSDFVRAFVAS